MFGVSFNFLEFLLQNAVEQNNAEKAMKTIENLIMLSAFLMLLIRNKLIRVREVIIFPESLPLLYETSTCENKIEEKKREHQNKTSSLSAPTVSFVLFFLSVFATSFRTLANAVPLLWRHI